VLEYAREQQKPILVSIGYAACHWCHVMAHESFEDPKTAHIMNANFVNIKVDREERPDVDQIHMAAIHAFGEQGGWPLNVFLTDDSKPFFAGTYFPPVPAHGRPSFQQVLTSLSHAWKHRRNEVFQNAVNVMDHLTKITAPLTEHTIKPVDCAVIRQFQEKTLRLFDSTNGGVKGAPKFPNTNILDTWLQLAGSNPKAEAAQAFIFTLERLSNGGIYDHVGGGLARYTVDERWLVPHFEKMLYDNAHFLRHLSIAYQWTKADLFRKRIEETIQWLNREMAIKGAFASSIDADSEGEEGKFYVWNAREIKEILGNAYETFAVEYNVSETGNWEGKTILNRLHESSKTALSLPQNYSCLDQLARERAKRVSPGRDDKVLTDWNGFLIEALAYAGAVFSNTVWLDMAETAFHCVTESKKLSHSYLEKEGNGVLFLSDLAALCLAAFTLHEATGKQKWLTQAEDFAGRIIHECMTDDNSWFAYTVGNATELIVEPDITQDDANPSPAALALRALTKVISFSNKPDFHTATEKLVRGLQTRAEGTPYALVSGLSAIDFWQNHSLITIRSKDIKPWLSALNSIPDPNRIVLWLPEDGMDLADHIQAANMLEIDTALICRNQTCGLPVKNPRDLLLELQRRNKPQ